jgi:DNA-binding response OmpR family regulator
VATTVEPNQVKLLLADDDMEILRIMRKRFSKRGYQLIEAHNGEEALQVALAERPNLIVLDVMMPRLNGWEVCKYIRDREAYNDVGVIMLTAIGPKLNELTSPLYGADEYMDKPFVLDELEDTIKRVLLERADLEVVAASPTAD